MSRQVLVSLAPKQNSLWQACYFQTNEMMITPEGSAIDPRLAYEVKRLEADKFYRMKIHFKPTAREDKEPKKVTHEDGIKTGSHWMRHPITFDSVRILYGESPTNPSEVQLLCHRKYLPVLSVEEVSSAGGIVSCTSFLLPFMEFFTVQRIQNKWVANLKKLGHGTSTKWKAMIKDNQRQTFPNLASVTVEYDSQNVSQPIRPFKRPNILRNSSSASASNRLASSIPSSSSPPAKLRVVEKEPMKNEQKTEVPVGNRKMILKFKSAATSHTWQQFTVQSPPVVTLKNSRNQKQTSSKSDCCPTTSSNPHATVLKVSVGKELKENKSNDSTENQAPCNTLAPAPTSTSKKQTSKPYPRFKSNKLTQFSTRSCQKYPSVSPVIVNVRGSSPHKQRSPSSLPAGGSPPHAPPPTPVPYNARNLTPPPQPERSPISMPHPRSLDLVTSHPSARIPNSPSNDQPATCTVKESLCDE